MPETLERRDASVRSATYKITVKDGLPPTIAHLAQHLALNPRQVAESCERLATAKALVLQPTSREILMAEPFSAVPTAFAVDVAGRRYFGNCIWDALGIPAMLGSDAMISTACACCGEAMELSVSRRGLAPCNGLAHFAIPAQRWWEDIVFT